MGAFSDEPTQIRELPFVGGDRILVADADLSRRAWLRQAVGRTFGIEEVDNARDVLARLTSDPPKVLVVGSDLADISGSVLLTHAARHNLVGPHRGAPIVFLLADSADTVAAVDEQQIPIFYRLTPGLQLERVRELMTQAFARGAPQQQRASEEHAARTHQIAAHAKRLGALQTAKAAATAAIAAVLDVTRADRARCLYYDDDSGTLWSESDDGDDESAASEGLAGFVARAGGPIVLERAAADQAYRSQVDDPAGTGNERLAMMPVVDRDRRVQAVLIAIREPAKDAFGDDEIDALRELAQAWSPFISQLALAAEAENDHSNEDAIFRQQAIQYMVRRGHTGDVIRIHPGWINGAFWVVLAAVAAGGVYGALARVHEYTEGVSVVRVTGRTDMIAYDGGSVTGLEVAPGQDVVAGQVLLRLHDTEQANRMRGLDAEFERKLVAYLQSPADPALRESLSTLVAGRDSAKANLEARVLRAPHDGVIRDVLVSLGQRVDPGRVVVTIARKDVTEGLSVLAFLPGADRPRLQLGQPVRMTLPGYHDASVTTTVRAISSEAIGAADAKARYLGDRLADSVQVQGSVVVIEAALPATFSSNNQEYELHDGMVGKTEVQLESKTVLETALPWLKG